MRIYAVPSQLPPRLGQMHYHYLVHWHWPRQSHLSHETLPSPYRRLVKSLYVGGFHVILGAYTPGSRRIPAVEPLVARRVLILACTIACKSLRSLRLRVPGKWIHPDQTDIETRKYEGKEVYDLHGARFERTTWSNLATQLIFRQLSELGHGVIVKV